MTKPLLICALLLFKLSPAHAIGTTQVPQERLFELGARLEAASGSSQWQMLWQRTRASGLLQGRPGQLHFAVAPSELAAMARSTLAQAHQVEPFAETGARYRRAFSPQVVGRLDGRALHALCLDVDWRALPPNAVTRPQAYLNLVTLHKAYPCD